MDIASITAPAKSATTAAASTATSAGTVSEAANFAASLTDAVNTAKKKEADFVSGRLGIQLQNGVPAQFIYFDDQGKKLTSSTFSAEGLLRNTKELGISLGDLGDLGAQLDAAGVGYKPYELYKGTGSDHGIDFNDLMAGGLGTAYDWTQDAYVNAKGVGAAEQLEQARALASSLKLTVHSDVTTNKGIDPGRFTTLSAAGESPRSHVMFNGGVAAWYGSSDQAATAASTYGGSVISVVAPADSTVDTAIAESAANSTIASADSSTANSAAAADVSSTSTSASAARWNAQLQSLIETLRSSQTADTTAPLLQVLNGLLKSS